MTVNEVPCVHCGEPYGHHRASDNLCPGRREDGTVWRGHWKDSTTHFQMSDEDEARRRLYSLIERSEMTKISVAVHPEKFGITKEEAARLREELLRVYPNLAWAFTESEATEDA